jgi:hypothetical protein
MKAHDRAKRDKAEAEEKRFETEKTGNAVVKIYSRQRRTVTGDTRTVWEVADYRHRVRRMLGFNGRAAAQAEAKRNADALSTGDAAGAEMSNREAASYGRAVELLRGLDVPFELAAAHHAEAFKILGGDRLAEAAKEFIRRNPTEHPARNIAEVTDELLEVQTKRQKSTSFVEDLRTRLTVFGSQFANCRVDSITGPDVQDYLDKLCAAPRMMRNVRNNVKPLFKFAESRDYFGRGENPVRMS